MCPKTFSESGSNYNGAQSHATPTKANLKGWAECYRTGIRSRVEELKLLELDWGGTLVLLTGASTNPLGSHDKDRPQVMHSPCHMGSLLGLLEDAAMGVHVQAESKKLREEAMVETSVKTYLGPCWIQVYICVLKNPIRIKNDHYYIPNKEPGISGSCRVR